MRSKIYLPKTFEELKKLNVNKQTELWMRYSQYPYHYIKSLWYYITCENTNNKIKSAYIIKLNKYSLNPQECMFKVHKTKYNLSTGTEIVKKYKSNTYKVLVKSDKEFIYNDSKYNTISAVAMAICNKKVSGYDFFGLNNKTIKKIGKNNE